MLKLNIKKLLIILLLISTFLRLYRLEYPEAYVFDEVYHAFTAKEYLKGSVEAWEWWTTPPPGVAFEWTHPPIAKEIMTASMYILNSTNAWAWRLPGALLGILNIYLLFLLAKEIFKSEKVALLSAFVFSLDGLNFVQSRTGMNDVYLVSAILLSLIFYKRRRFMVSALMLGIAIADKWTGVYLLIGYFLLLTNSKDWKNIFYYCLAVPIIYMISYFPFFLLGHSPYQFLELQQQMYYYHTHLKATHDYASAWWTWPFNLVPVWFYVGYFPNDYIANIFTSGNLAVFFAGIVAGINSIKDIIFKRDFNVGLVLFLFLLFWLPWSISPRIMFLYHFTPCMPFLSMLLGYQLSKLTTKLYRKQLIAICAFLIIGFGLTYPFLTGIPLPKNIVQYFFYTNAAKNPFGN